MRAQPWQERRREYLAAKDQPAARVIRIDEFLADCQNSRPGRQKGGGDRESGRGTSDDAAPDLNLGGGAA